MKHVLDSKFIKKYKKEMIDSMLKMNPSWDKDMVEEEVDKIIKEELQIPNVEMDNNYTKEHKQASLLSVFDWCMERKPIIAGNGTFYKNQHEAMNPIADMLDGMLTSRKGYKKQMFKIEDPTSKEYKDLDRQQANEKINCNSYYGASGMPSSAFYSLWSGPATTLSAQSVISTTETTFEAFVADNYLFIDLTECIHWMNTILSEEIILDPWINRDITEDMVYERISSKFLKFKSSYEAPLRSYIHHLENDELVRLYYKNNLIKFVDDHEYMKTLHELIFLNVKNLEYVDKDNPNWRDELLRNPEYEELKFKDVSEWNHFVNNQFFMDPNDVPASIKEYVEEFSSKLFTYVYARYLSFDRIYRLKNFKRKVVTVIDTDSNILSLDTWVNYAYNNIRKEDYGRSKENNIFIIINTITHAITKVVTDILLTYGKYSNVPEEYRPRYNMKNEFLFGKLVIGKTKKRYLSKIILREGNYMNPPKYDIKGFDFMKATTSEESEKFYRYLVKKYILDPDSIDISSILHELKMYQNEIYESLKRGERIYLPNANAKELEAYKEPGQEQSVRGTLAWNFLYPENMIEYPSKVSIVKLNIFEEKDILPLRETHPEIYNIIMEKIFHDKTGIFVTEKWISDKKGGKKKVVKSKGMQVLAIPSNSYIPEWALDYIDYTTMINNIIAPFKSVLEILGNRPASVGKTINGVNRKTEKLTNIIKI